MPVPTWRRSGLKRVISPSAAVSGCAHNARQIRDYSWAADLEPGEKAVLRRLLQREQRTSWKPWVSLSRGPSGVAAVVSVAGAVGGSPWPRSCRISIFRFDAVSRPPTACGGWRRHRKPEAPHAPPLAVESSASGGDPLLLAGELCGREETSAIMRPKYDHLAPHRSRNDGSVVFLRHDHPPGARSSVMPGRTPGRCDAFNRTLADVVGRHPGRATPSRVRFSSRPRSALWKKI